MRDCRRGLRRAIVLGGLLVCAAPRADAQRDEGDLPVRPFALRDVSGWLDFEYENEEEERVGGSGGSTRKETREEFSEALRINTRSYIYHPYLVDLHLGGRIRAKQGTREFSPSTVNTSEDEDFFSDAILADATFFKRKPLVTHLFYHRQVEEQDVSGLGDLGTFELDSDTYGGTLLYRSREWPASLSVTQRDLRGLGANEVDEEDFNSTFTLGNRTANLDSRLRATYDDRVDDFRNTETETANAELSQTLQFGDSLQHLWTSQLSYFDETGTVERQEVDVREEVQYALTDRWHSRVSGFYQTVDLEADSVDSWTAQGELTHDLYESLRSSALVEATQVSSDFTDSATYSGELRFRYKKRVPRGRLTAGLRLRERFFAEESTGTTQLVIDESHTFGAEPVLLDNPNVDVASVLLTDPTGLITYVEGLDYLLVARGTLTEVLRLATGGIPANGTILVDYEFAVSPELEYRSFLVATDFRLTQWEWLALYGRAQHDEPTVTKGDDLGRVNPFTSWLFGAEADYWRLTFTGEIESYDSGLTEYDRQHLRVNYSDVVYENWNAFASAGWTLTSFAQTDEDITTIELRGGLRGWLRRNLRAEVDGWLTTEDGRKLASDTDVEGVRARLEYRYRQVLMRLSFIYALQEDSAGQRQERQEVSFLVRRFF